MKDPIHFLIDPAARLSGIAVETVAGPLGRIAFRRAGVTRAGQPALVLIHGWGCNMRFFERQLGTLPGLSFALDLPGHGASDPVCPDQLSLPSLTDSIAAFCERLGLSRVVLIGHSYGGFISMFAASKIPGLAGVVVLDQPLKPLPDQLEVDRRLREAREDVEDVRLAHFVRRLLRGKFTEPETARIIAAGYAVPRALRVGMSEIMYARVAAGFEKIPTIESPLLSLASSLSHDWFGGDYVQYLRAISPPAEHDEIPGASHYLMLDAATEVNARLTSWLGGLARPARASAGLAGEPIAEGGGPL